MTLNKEQLELDKNDSIEYPKNGRATKDQATQHEQEIPPELELDENNFINEKYERMTPYSYFLFACGAIGGLLFGYDTGIISAALVNIGTDIDGKILNNQESEWATASLSAGALVGGLFTPWLADKYGRKVTLFIADIIFVIGAVLIAASFHYEMLVVGRAVMGGAVGITAAITPAYLGELAPTRLRGALVSVQSLMITGGQVIAYSLGAGFTFHGGWRALFALSILPSIFQGVMIHWLPESPRFHILKGRIEEAEQTLKIIYKDATQDFIQVKLRYIKANVEYSRKFQEKYSLVTRLGFIFRRGHYFRPSLVAFVIMFWQQLSGFTPLMYYSATMFKAAGFSNGSATGIIVAATNFVFTGVSAYSMEKLGKRRTMLIAYPMMIFGLIMCSIAFLFMTKHTNGRLVEGEDYPEKWTNMMIGMLVIFIAFYALGLGNIPWHGAELFPLEIRGLGAMLVNTANWAANLIVSSTYLSLMDKITVPGTFGFYAGLSALGCIFVFFFYPELAGLSLEEVRILFEDGFGLKKSKQIRKAHADAINV